MRCDFPVLQKRHRCMLEMVLASCGFVFSDRKPGLTSRLTLSYNLSFTQNRLNYATPASPPRLSEHGHFWVWGATDWLRQDLSCPRWLQYSENDLEILMPLLPPKCWNHRCVPLCQVHTVLEIEPRAPFMLSTYSTNWALRPIGLSIDRRDSPSLVSRLCWVTLTTTILRTANDLEESRFSYTTFWVFQPPSQK